VSGGGVSLRPWAASDSVARLTEFLHRAYAELASRGLRFNATHQDEAHTAKRIAGGQCWIAEIDGELVGTVIFRPPERAAGCPFFDRPEVATFEQLAVAPELRGRGIAAALLALCERLAREAGALELALDTAEPASDLCAYYARHGYRFVEFVRWDDTNYRSVVLSKRLGVRVPRDDEERFVCDAMLGGLARWLRARPRAFDKHQQLAFVLDVLDLAPREPPRCMECGGALASVPKESVRTEAPRRTFAMQDEFWRCSVCGKLLWHGAHWERIAARLATVVRSSSG
jgi:GNAT superfamily N-acetyltransferase